MHIQDLVILVALVQFILMPRPGRRHYIHLGILLALTLAVEVVASIGIHVFHGHMNLAINIYDLFQLPLLLLFYRNQTQWRYRNVVAYTLLGVSIVFSLVNLFFIQGIHNFNAYSPLLTSVCISVISITYLFKQDLHLTNGSSLKQPMHWINIAMLFYYTATLFIFLWIDYLVQVVKSNLIHVWYIHHSIGLVYFGTLCYIFARIRHEHNKLYRVS